MKKMKLKVSKEEKQHLKAMYDILNAKDLINKNVAKTILGGACGALCQSTCSYYCRQVCVAACMTNCTDTCGESCYQACSYSCSSAGEWACGVRCTTTEALWI